MWRRRRPSVGFFFFHSIILFVHLDFRKICWGPVWWEQTEEALLLQRKMVAEPSMRSWGFTLTCANVQIARQTWAGVTPIGNDFNQSAIGSFGHAALGFRSNITEFVKSLDCHVGVSSRHDMWLNISTARILTVNEPLRWNCFGSRCQEIG